MYSAQKSLITRAGVVYQKTSLTVVPAYTVNRRGARICSMHVAHIIVRPRLINRLAAGGMQTHDRGTVVAAAESSGWKQMAESDGDAWRRQPDDKEPYSLEMDGKRVGWTQ